jgi:hypothetical protein
MSGRTRTATIMRQSREIWMNSLRAIANTRLAAARMATPPERVEPGGGTRHLAVRSPAYPAGASHPMIAMMASTTPSSSSGTSSIMPVMT